MVDFVDFTPAGGWTVSTTGLAPDKVIVDASGYRSVDLVLTALAVGGTLTVRMETALTLDAPEWQSLGVFTPLIKPASTDRRRFDGVLRYVRWRVETLSGGDAVFTLAGTAV